MTSRVLTACPIPPSQVATGVRLVQLPDGGLDVFVADKKLVDVCLSCQLPACCYDTADKREKTGVTI